MLQIYALSSVKFPHLKMRLCKKMTNMRYASTPTLLKFIYLSDVEVVHCFLSFAMQYIQHIMEAGNLPVRSICVWRTSLWPDLSPTALSFVSNSKPQLRLISLPLLPLQQLRDCLFAEEKLVIINTPDGIVKTKNRRSAFVLLWFVC